MENLLLKLSGIINPNNVNRILVAKKHRLQEELHKASEERNFVAGEEIGNELVKVNKALNKYKC